MNTLRAVVALVVGLLCPATVASAACPLGPVTPQTGMFALPAAKYTQALTYIDLQCLPEARMLLAEAAAGLAPQPGDRAGVLRNLVASARDYVAAVDAIQRGDQDRGYQQLQQIIERGTNVVSLRAVMKLASAIVRQPNSERWHTVEEPLQELSRRGFVTAEILLIERRIAGEGVTAGIAEVEQRLDNDPDLQRGLSLRIFLVELYARADRLIDAALMLNALEADASDTLLDLEMRKKLLIAGVTIWSALVGQGRPEFIPYRAAYVRALAEIRAFVP